MHTGSEPGGPAAFTITVKQFKELVELAGNLHAEAERCRDCGRWAAALFFLGGSAEAALLATAGVFEPELRATGLWNPPKGDPTKWTLGALGNIARNAGWLPAQSLPDAQEIPRQRPAQAGEEDIFTCLDGETGDALRFVERLRNMTAHPGAYVSEPLRPDTANDEHMRQTYGLMDGIHRRCLRAPDNPNADAAGIVVRVLASGHAPACVHLLRARRALVKITKEHLFSQWVDDILTPELLGPDRSFERTTTGRDGTASTKRWPTEVLAAIEAAVVCGSQDQKRNDGCNDGWMSKLDGRAKELLAPMMLGETRTLSSRITSSGYCRTRRPVAYHTRSVASGRGPLAVARTHRQASACRRAATGRHGRGGQCDRLGRDCGRISHGSPGVRERRASSALLAARP